VNSLAGLLVDGFFGKISNVYPGTGRALVGIVDLVGCGLTISLITIAFDPTPLRCLQL